MNMKFNIFLKYLLIKDNLFEKDHSLKGQCK